MPLFDIDWISVIVVVVGGCVYVLSLEAIDIFISFPDGYVYPTSLWFYNLIKTSKYNLNNGSWFSR